MDEKVQKYLLSVAKTSIAVELGIFIEKVDRPDVSILDEKRGVFVTLEIDGKLRGCIGNIMPVYSIEEAVKNNAESAAFRDPRFSPLIREEFDSLTIEISILTIPKELSYDSPDDLLEKLVPMKHGVVLKKGGYSSTYLPQVWDDLPDKERFLESLCIKAGLHMDEWRKGDLEVLVYEVEKFGA